MLSHLHGSSMYKRLTSRDDMDSFDIEENSGKFVRLSLNPKLSKFPVL